MLGRFVRIGDILLPKNVEHECDNEIIPVVLSGVLDAPRFKMQSEDVHFVDPSPVLTQRDTLSDFFIPTFQACLRNRPRF